MIKSSRTKKNQWNIYTHTHTHTQWGPNLKEKTNEGK
jgi:hypothetical protein